MVFLNDEFLRSGARRVDPVEDATLENVRKGQALLQELRTILEKKQRDIVRCQLATNGSSQGQDVNNPLLALGRIGRLTFVPTEVTFKRGEPGGVEVTIDGAVSGQEFQVSLPVADIGKHSDLLKSAFAAGVLGSTLTP